MKRAAQSAALDAPPPTSVPPPACREPARRVRLARAVQTPRLAQSDLEVGSGTVEVQVVVDDGGKAMNATVVRSSLNSAMGAYNEAITSFDGRVLSNARKLHELKAATGEELTRLDTLDLQAKRLTSSDWSESVNAESVL